MTTVLIRDADQELVWRMVVRLRIQRFGVKTPYYRIVAADSKFPRNGRFCQIVGAYDPCNDAFKEKFLALDVKAIKKWLAQGAQPTDRVHKLLALANVLPPHWKTQHGVTKSPKTKEES